MSQQTSELDLNGLRDLVKLHQQSANNADKPPTREQVVVTPEGLIAVTTDTSQHNLSTVPLDTFAGRVDEDRLIVQQFLPKNSSEITTKEGVVGWAFSIKCQFGHDYTFFAFFDGANYQVKLVSPELETKWMSPHTGHIFKNGTLCLGNRYGAGRPTLRDAYAKTVLWATGISTCILRPGSPFPFSINNVEGE